MATVFYDKAAVNVSFGGINETLLASNCTINFSSPSQPIYAIGSKGTLGQFPAGARVGDMSFGFVTSITGLHNGYRGNLINYLASGIKNATNSEASGVQIKCAGITGYGFLNSYSFNVASNAVSTSSASFTFFGSGTQLPVSGFIHGQDSQVLQTGVLATGIAHGRYSNLNPLRTTITSPTETANIFGADYSLSMAHNPVYTIGQEFPLTTFYSTAQESVNVTEDVFDNALAFDETASDLTLNLQGLIGIGTESFLQQVGISGAKQQGTSMAAGLDDIIRTQKTLTAAY